MKNGFEKSAIAFTALFSLDLVNAPRSPGDHGRINIAEIPLVCRDLAVWMLIPFPHDEIQLALRKFCIDERQRNTMKRKVPRCVPWKFPLIRHRHYAFVVQ